MGEPIGSSFFQGGKSLSVNTLDTPILGIDHGVARIGVAISDGLRMFAHPLETIDRKKIADPILRIAQIVEENRVGTVVVGMPYRLSGTSGSAAERVRQFIAKLQHSLGSEVKIATSDERLTTVEASRRLREAGKDNRQQKAMIDQAAAVILLQDYLDELAGPSAFLLDEDFDPEFDT